MKFKNGDIVKLTIKEPLCLKGFETGNICEVIQVLRCDKSKQYRIEKISPDNDFRTGYANEDELELAELKIAVHETGLSISDDYTIDALRYAVNKKQESVEYDAKCLGVYNKGEENYMKILEIYERRKKEEIYEKNDELKKEVRENDNAQKIILDAENQLNVLLDRDEYNRITLYNRDLMEDETVKKIKSINLKQEKELTSLEKLIEEIKAQLEITENYDQKMCILVRYGVLNEQWKIDDGKEEPIKKARKVK